MLIYRIPLDDGSKRAYQGAMRKLDRVEGILRTFRKSMQLGAYGLVEARILQVAIDRAVSKRIRLCTAWWKE